MKKIMLILPVAFMLAGCPGCPRGPEPRATFINGERLCFSIDKKDVLNYYTISSSESSDYEKLRWEERLHRSYPDTCIKIKFKFGYTYYIRYGLNNESYEHDFFIDNNGNLTHLGGV
ncbi:putative T6SS immunity periplasmic lipoprotein [Superficieibacter sp. BNK-5]|uniref:putative T6SS immunity periplasmic lipoprotein n=1 Tax=Superficieibacter sp. BNK-5 TaxID=3376142 RepID=UPI0039BF6BF2